MKIKYISLLSALLPLCLSCSKNDDAAQVCSEKVSLSVSFDAADGDPVSGLDPLTRVNFTKEGVFSWNDTDKIGVKTSGTYKFTPLSLDVEHSESSSAVFTGEISGTLGDYAVYPYNENTRISDDTGNIIFNLPSEYTYTSVDKDYFSGSNGCNVPLYGKIEKNDEGKYAVKFCHAGGLLCIKVNKLPASSGYVSVTADRQLSGDFAADLTVTTPQIYTNTSPYVDSAKSASVTFYYSGAAAGDPGVFYLPMPVGTYNILVHIGYEKDNEGYSYSTGIKSLTVERRAIVPRNITPGTYLEGRHLVDGHIMIDLGLPSPYDKLLWASCNIGCLNEVDFGSHFMWGETASCETGRTGSDNCSQNGVDWEGKSLTSNYDVATESWGAKFRIPTIDELVSLYNQGVLSWTWVERYQNVDNLNGYKIFNKTQPNKYIFLPMAGYYNDKGQFGNKGTEGRYWSSTAYDTTVLGEENHADAYFIYFTKEYSLDTQANAKKNTYRTVGCSVRPVATRE